MIVQSHLGASGMAFICVYLFWNYITHRHKHTVTRTYTCDSYMVYVFNIMIYVTVCNM